jgi:hypothetical protein
MILISSYSSEILIIKKMVKNKKSTKSLLTRKTVPIIIQYG